MGEGFSIVKEWVELISYFATSVGMISVIIAIFIFFKNRVSPKTLRVPFKIRKVDFWEDCISFDAKIGFENFTDKSFSIICAFFCVNSGEYLINVQYPAEKSLRPISNLFLDAHESVTFENSYIEIPFNENFKKSKLKVKTTFGNFVYRIDVRQARNRIEEFKK